MKHLSLLLGCVLMLLQLSGCSEKTRIEYNKPALHWYQLMLDEIRRGDLEEADDAFASLRSEHVHSPLLPEAMLILARAHMEDREYLLARFYLDEYLKRYGTEETVDFAKQQKILAGYRSFSLSGQDQELLRETIKEAEGFLQEHPYSLYRPLVDTMLVTMRLAQMALNEEIASLYERRDKPEAAEIYRNKVEFGWLDKMLYDAPEVPWYMQIFNW